MEKTKKLRKIKSKKSLIISVILLASFIIWTVILCFADVRAVGPEESSVGLGGLNEYFHGLTGANMLLYTITDWLGLVPICVAFCFAVLGAIQLIRRRSLFAVDHDILALGVFYACVLAGYLLFEFVVINYRPVLIEGRLEVSYPSSTTMLVISVMSTAIIQFNRRIKNHIFRNIVIAVVIVFIAFMVVGRVLSGVHWITDIIGGALLSTGLATGYYFVLKNII